MNELEDMRQRVAVLEASKAKGNYTKKVLPVLEEDYERLYGTLPIGVTIVDMKGVILYCNHAVYDKGYAETEFVGKHFSKISSIRVKDIPIFIRVFNSIIRGKTPEPFEAYYKSKDGTTGWTELHVSLIKAGRKRRILVTQYDITERKQAEEEFKNIFNLSPDMVGVFTTEGKLIRVNLSWERILGYKAEELLKMDWTELVHPDDVERTNKEVEKQLKGSPVVNFINRYKCKDGSYKTLEWQATFAEEGVVHATARDITERKRTEETMRNSEEKYHTLHDTMAQGVIYRDKNGKLISMNPAAERILGVQSEQMVDLKTSIRNIRRIHEDGSEYKVEEIPTLLSLRTGKPVKNTVTGIYIPQEDNYRWISIDAVPQFKPGEDEPYQVFITFTDITERKKAEEGLQIAEQNFRNSMDDSPLGIRIVTAEWELLYANRAILNIIGYSSFEEMRDTPAKQRLTPESYAEHMERVEMRKREEFGPSTFEVDIVRKDGEIRHLQVFRKEVIWNGERQFQSLYQDITEQKQLEKTLRDSDQNFRNSMDDSPLGIRIITAERELLYANQTILNIYGYSSFEEMRDTPSKQRYTPESYAEHQERIEERKRGEFGPSNYEISIVRKDGEIRHLQAFRKEVNWNGERQFQVLYHDITERKQIEEELQIAEQNYRNSMDDSPLAIRIITAERELLYANQVALDIYGYSSFEEMRDTPAEQRFTLKSNAEHQERIEERKRGGFGPPNYEISIVRKNGEIRHLRVFRKEVTWNGERQFQSLYQDITEQKQVEEALRESEENFRNSMDDSPLGIRVFTIEGELLYANQAILDVYGYSSFEELRDTPRKQRYTPESYAEHQERVEKRKRGELRRSYQMSIVRKNGEIRHLQAFRKEVIWNGEKQFQSLYQDITEWKQAEEREKQLQQELIQSSRLATTGEMAAGIAHEINNPLTGVLGFANLLLKKDIPEDIRKELNIIHEGAQRISSVTNRMLSFAHQHKPEQATVNINDIIEATLTIRSYEMESSNIKVTTELDPELPVIIADAAQMQQVFLNIILNAEIEMKKAHQGGNLAVKSERIDNTIRISFKDDGPGIPKKNLDKIFDPFFTTRKVGEGTGLGLSVSYGIVMQHGGKIYAQSRLGRGATFIVELPIVTRAEQLEFTEHAVEENKGIAGCRILVVDDDPLVQQFLSEVLGEEGHEVEIVDNGDDALERLSNEDYDVILLDVKLPGMNGIDLYKQIQRSIQSLASRVIFITGDVMSADTMVFIKSAGISYLTKPFDTEQLKKEINHILGQ